MEEELSMDNILSADEIEGLFEDQEIQDTQPEENEENTDENQENNNEETEETTEVTTENTSEKPEGVGSEDNIEEQEDTTSNKSGSSPKNNFYSSIAKAFAEEGIFPDLDDESASKIKTPEEFRDLIEDRIKSELDERQKRVDEALNAGVEPSDIRKYENTISYLDSIKDETITSENEEGEKLRKQLIYQDFVNRGYSQERATREVKKSFDAGTDIEDAKEALKSNLEFFQGQYDNLIEEAKAEEEKEIKQRKEQAEKLKKSILEDKEVFGELSIDKKTRQKIFDNISKPVYKDPNTGQIFTALQKYEMENRTDFLKNVSLVFTLTDGFKNLDGLVKGKVKKEVKKGIRELENVLNNTARTSDGNLRFVSNVEDDPESFIGQGWTLDVYYIKILDNL